ncbi:MAG: hypothetical protein ACJASF_002552 [Vicingaceae bacterium]|jgi:hypothetical protein
MKRILIISLFILLGLGSFAQSFVVDTTFQPFFDIRAQTNPIINGIYEDQRSGRLYVAGNFSSNFIGRFYDGLVTYDSLGQLSLPFRFGNGSPFGNGVSDITYNSINRLTVHYSGSIGFIDTTGNWSYPNFNWLQNRTRTVACGTGRPLAFPNGSSLFANGRDGTGKACKIIQGTDTFPGRHIIKLTPQGFWDSTFNHDATYGNPDGFFQYDSNRIIIYGNPLRFTHYDSIPIEGMCRIYLDGTLDTTFTSPINPNIFWITAVDNVQHDGKFFLIGSTYLKGDTIKTPLARINPDGSIDATFQYRNGAVDVINGFEGINTVVTTEDKGYLVGGYFTHYQGVQRKSIVKLDSNGLLEPQYFTALGPDSADPFLFRSFQGMVSKIILSKFGGYYVGGNFLKWDGQASQPLIKITGLNGGIPVGIDETLLASTFTEQDMVKVYPNPANGIVTFESEVGIETVEVYDLRGKLLQNSFKLLNSRSVTEVDLTNFNSGIYFLKLMMENGEGVTKKIIKQ